jgi:K+-sensing histidine kinase KdpD
LGEIKLTLSNPTNDLTAADLPSIFEPFWRKDKSRTDSSRSGLGLSIVASYARILGLSLNAAMLDGRFAVSIAFPTRDETPSLPHPPREGNAELSTIVPPNAEPSFS